MNNNPDSLELECERLWLLCRCAEQLRAGASIPTEWLSEIETTNAGVRAARAEPEHFARVLTGQVLADIELDVLASAIGAELDPRLPGAYHRLGNAPYPTRALLLELFALTPREAGPLLAAFADSGPLRRLGLVALADSGHFAPIRPGAGVTASVLGVPLEAAPPGASLVPVRAGWSDLVVPDECARQLREFLAWIRHRDTVVTSWGGQDVGGPVALFCGPSGTGKTFAAGLIANELGWPLYRADIGSLVSKYVGETEKNMNRLFEATHGRHVVLLFDEADSLFGRRSEVRDARDRYANLEVSHLLTKIELHRGPCILTSNLRDNIDSAFLRRFHTVVEVPRPGVAARARLWQLHVPVRAPTERPIDFSMLGAAVNLTGAGIRNAALHAAYLAADAGHALRLSDLALAVWRELGKHGSAVVRAELGPLAEHLP